MGCSALLSGMLGFVLLGASQEPSPPRLSVAVTAVKAQGNALRVSLRGETDASDGLYGIRISPLIYKVSGTGDVIARIPEEQASLLRQVRVRDGAFTVTVSLARPQACELRLLPIPPSSGFPLRVATFQAVEPASTRQRLKKEMLSLEEFLRELAEYLSGLAPYEQPREGAPLPTIPAGLQTRLAEIQKRIATWTRESDFTATGYFLKDLIVGLRNRLPWDEAEEAASSPYPQPKRERKAPQVDGLKAQLLRAREIALREGMLRLLGSFDALAGKWAEGDGASLTAGAAQTLKESRECFEVLVGGPLAETSRAYAPAEELRELLAGRESDAAKDPVDPKVLWESLGAVRLKVAGASP